MDGDIGEDARPGNEPEPVGGQIPRAALARSFATSEIHGPAVFSGVQQARREKPAEGSIDAEPRTTSVHPVQRSSAHPAMTVIPSAENTPVLGPVLSTVDVVRDGPMFLPTRRYTRA